MSDAISDQARISCELGIEFSLDADTDSLVLHGPSRTVFVRRLTIYQVDERRFTDSDEAFNAALTLFM